MDLNHIANIKQLSYILSVLSVCIGGNLLGSLYDNRNRNSKNQRPTKQRV